MVDKVIKICTNSFPVGASCLSVVSIRRTPYQRFLNEVTGNPQHSLRLNLSNLQGQKQNRRHHYPMFSEENVMSQVLYITDVFVAFFSNLFGFKLEKEEHFTFHSYFCFQLWKKQMSQAAVKR